MIDRSRVLVAQWRQDLLALTHGSTRQDMGYADGWNDATKKRADQLEAAILAPPEPQWQPIETAPKDGAAVLTVVAGKIPFVAWWCGGDEYGGFWRGDAGYRVYPSHWQPLPAPPETAPQP